MCERLLSLLNKRVGTRSYAPDDRRLKEGGGVVRGSGGVES